jgi:hypothetical protein
VAPIVFAFWAVRIENHMLLYAAAEKAGLTDGKIYELAAH